MEKGRSAKLEFIIDMLKTYSLPNGTHIATYHLPNLKSIHLRISTKGGSIVESAEDSGLAHFMEHMLVQGIPSYPTAEEFSRYIEGLAGNYGAYTEKLSVSFNITLPASHIEDAVRIANEVFFHPLFREEAVEKERNAVIDEIRQRRDSHWYKISEFFLKSRFAKNHPLLRDGGGELDIIKRLTTADFKRYWHEYFHPNNTYILITGAFESDKLEKLLHKYFAPNPNGRYFAGFPEMTNRDLLKKNVAIRTDKKLSTCYVDLTLPAIEMMAPVDLRVKQNVALVILGQLRNSRLFKLLRYQKGLVYDARAGGVSYPGLGYASASMEVGCENIDEALVLMVSELKNFMTNGPTKEELDFAKNYLTSQWDMAFDHPSSIASWVEGHLLWDDKILLPDDYARLIKGITAEDIVEMIGKHWDFTKTILTIQGPLASSKEKKEEYMSLISTLTEPIQKNVRILSNPVSSYL
jgi:predicted Zn-dependent peptidase